MTDSPLQIANELLTLRRAVKRLGIRTDYWEEGEYIATNEHGVVGMTLARDEREAIDRANQL